MPNVNKVSRDQRDSLSNHLSRPRKRPNPNKNKKVEAEARSSSDKKIRLSSTPSEPVNFDTHFKVVDFVLVFSTLSTLVKCKECNESVEFKTCSGEGLAFKIQVKCKNCSARYIPSCTKIGQRYEVNYRFAFIMRILGLGLSACDKFCGLMDLSSSFLSKTTYNSYIKTGTQGSAIW